MSKHTTNTSDQPARSSAASTRVASVESGELHITPKPAAGPEPEIDYEKQRRLVLSQLTELEALLEYAENCERNGIDPNTYWNEDSDHE